MQEPDVNATEQLERATESTWAKAMTRFVTPILLSVIGFFMVQTLGDIRQNQNEAVVREARRDMQISDIKSDVRVINTRLDIQVISRIGQLEKKVDELERAQQVK